MKVLALNWRDIKHPEAGGAEVHLHEILSHLVSWGHEATEVASAFPGCAREEEIDGVRIVRGGHWYDANFTLPLLAKKILAKNPHDVILEDINKLPFFMPLYTSTPVVGVIPHLFGSAVFRETNWLIGSYVMMMEKLIPVVFKNNRFMAISPSTADDLASRGIDSESISVVLCGLDHATYRDLHLERFKQPTVVHLGRLRKYKSVEVAMRAMKTVRASVPEARLLIIGDGPYRKKLEAEAESLDMGDAIQFLGYVGAEKTVEYLNRSHVLINPSPKEGWGLTVVEANACGVPVVASDRPGLRDSVIDNETGFLVPYGDAVAFGEKTARLLSDHELWNLMSSLSLERVRPLTWERCAKQTESLLLDITG